MIPAPVTVSATGSQTYGGSPSFLYATSPAGIALSGTLICTTVNGGTPIGASLAAGSYTIDSSSCSGLSDNNDTLTYKGRLFSVIPAPVTVNPTGSQTYGGSPSFSYTTSPAGIALSGTLICTTVNGGTPIGASLAAGSYTIDGSSCSGLSDNNYTTTYAGGTFKVLAAPLTVTASSGSFTYGGTPPAITASYAGFVNGDSPASLNPGPSCVTSATSSSPVAGNPYVSSCSGAQDSNYAISYLPGTVTVNPAPLTVTASSGSFTYGGTPPAITASYAGFVNGDSPASLNPGPSCVTSATSSSPVAGNPYVSSCSGAQDSNYAISYLPGTVTVNPAPLTVTADHVSRYYGSPTPALSATITGFVNGENLATSGVTGMAKCVTTATVTSDPGTYPITCTQGTLAASNYSFATFTPGTLVVTPDPTTITASKPNGSLLFTQFSATLYRTDPVAGVAGQTLTFTANGQVLCQAVTNASGTASCRVLGVSVGKNPYTVTYAGGTDYLPSTVNGAL